MQFGITLPYAEPDHDRQTTLEWCRRIDEGPFASLSTGERITGPSQEMRVLLSAAAALTCRVRIHATLYVLPMHSAVWAAKEIASLDVLSGGRVSVTVGVGGRECDYRAVGASFRRRHQRMDEQVDRMRRIWRGEPPFEGAEPVGPRPVQEGGPPLLIGAMGPRSMRRAAEWADGVYAFTMNGSPRSVEQWFRMADEAWRDAGRREPPRRVTGFWLSLADGAQEKLERYVLEYLAVFGEETARAVARTMTLSSPAAVGAAIDAIEALGCDELFLVPASADPAEVERAADLLAGRGRTP